VLLAIVLVSGQASELSGAADVRWYYLLGGLLGAGYVTAALVTVPTIGAGGVAAGTITGQLTASVIIDRFGILGLDEVPITLGRALGVGLLLAGTFLIIR
jgi:transporter family-2 protein